MELARLIGQNDPFAPVPPRGAPREQYQPKYPSQQYESQDGTHDRAPPVRPPTRDYSPAQDRHQDRYEPVRDDYSRHEPPRFPFRPDYAETDSSAANEPSPYAHHDDYQQGEDLHQPAATDWHHDEYADQPYSNQAYSDQSYSNQAYSNQPYSDQAYADHGYAEDGHVEAHPHDEAYATVPGQAPAAYDGQYGEPGAYDDGYEYAEHSDNDDGTATAKRRNTTKIAIAVLGLAVFGSAAAFGYRTVFKGGVSGPVPLIRADTSPTRVTPTGDGSGKPINERLSEGSERTMQRYEEPVDMRDASRGGNAVLPGASGSIPSVGGSPAASPTGGASGSTEPRRVRTVTIRADQGTPPAPERPAAPPPPQTRAAPPPPRQAAAPRETPSPRDTTQTATGSAGGAPMSIMPGSTEEAPTRVATAAPPQTRSSEGAGGGYVVQLSAQKTESEAQASFRAMQSKFPALNGQQPLIRRKDQGERGVFYAAQVGPFGSRDEANQLCENLKSAGGSCFVLRN
jgi:hypothetical protein